MQTPTALCSFSISRPILLRRQSEKYITKDSRYAHWIELYLSFHLSWVLGPFVHDRLQNMKTSEYTFGHDITPLIKETSLPVKRVQTGRPLMAHPGKHGVKLGEFLYTPDIGTN